jgi:hypothetical protein
MHNSSLETYVSIGSSKIFDDLCHLRSRDGYQLAQYRMAVHAVGLVPGREGSGGVIRQTRTVGHHTRAVMTAVVETVNFWAGMGVRRRVSVPIRRPEPDAPRQKGQQISRRSAYEHRQANLRPLSNRRTNMIYHGHQAVALDPDPSPATRPAPPSCYWRAHAGSSHGLSVHRGPPV